MRAVARVAALFLLVGCSSAGDLPLGGPYGGVVTDDAGSSGSDSGIVIVTAGSSGVGTSSGSTTFTAFSSGGGSSSNIVATTQSSATASSGSAASTQGTSTTSSTATSSSSSSAAAAAPTWTYLYTTYLAAGSTPGDCDGSCHHHSQCSSPTACYSWIGTGYNLGADGNLFCWDSDGFMPSDCPSSVGNAVADFAAWIAAGSQDN